MNVILDIELYVLNKTFKGIVHYKKLSKKPLKPDNGRTSKGINPLIPWSLAK